jgi:ankyrin repeat protein
MDFLESDVKVEASSQALLTFKLYSSHSNYSQEFPRQMTALHLTAYFGAETVMNALLKKGVKADSTDSDGRTPLSYAARRGHEAVVKLLLEGQGRLDTIVVGKKK